MQLSQLMAGFNLAGRARRVLRDAPYGPEHMMSLDVYAPHARVRGKRPVVVFWHGGSWNGGNKGRYVFMGAALAAMGVVAVVPDYRKYPDISYPVFAEDAALAVRWVYDHIEQYGGDPQKIVVMGHSAGGHTAAMVAYEDAYLRSAGVPRTALAAFVGIAGAYRLRGLTGQYRQIFPSSIKGEPWQLDEHLGQVRVAALILQGARDAIVRPDVARRMADAVRRTGSPVTYKTYSRTEHFIIIARFAWPLRLLAGPWRDTRDFLRGLAR